MKVLVCGGRDYDNAELVNRTLDALDPKPRFIIHGGARGADLLAELWSEAAGVPSMKFPADWNKHGNSAGPIRNQEMIDKGKPDLVVAFPGGRGTADMVRRARAAGVRVVEVG